jgi:hypothetical protein
VRSSAAGGGEESGVPGHRPGEGEATGKGVLVELLVLRRPQAVERHELDLVEAEPAQEGGGGAEIGLVVVEAGDHRDPNQDAAGPAARYHCLEIGEYLLVADAGAAAMGLAVHLLEVDEQPVEVRQGGEQGRSRRHGRRLERGVEVRLPTAFERREQEVGWASGSPPPKVTPPDTSNGVALEHPQQRVGRPDGRPRPAPG